MHSLADIEEQHLSQDEETKKIKQLTHEECQCVQEFNREKQARH